MPYKLRKAPKRPLYWVVAVDTGKKYSHEPIPLEKAKAQMRVLEASIHKELTGGCPYCGGAVGGINLKNDSIYNHFDTFPPGIIKGLEGVSVNRSYHLQQ